MMAYWNKVSPTCPYLDNIGYGVAKGPVRTWFVRSVGPLHILAVIVFILGISWLTFDVMIKTSSFGLFDNKVQYFQHFVL